MQELFPGEAPQPAGGQAAHVLRRLRLSARRPLALDLLICALSGAALSTALPPLDLGPIAFVAAAPLVWVVSRASRGRASLCGWVFGIAYLGLVSSWVLVAGWVAWLPLVLPFAVSYAGFAYLVPALWAPERPLRTAAAVAGWWTVMEFIRGFLPMGGYTWGTLGTTQHDNPLLLPLASLTGVWGISFVVAYVNTVVAQIAGVGEWRRTALAGALGAALIASPALIPEPQPGGNSVDVAVVQGSAPERRLFDRILEDRVVAENHARLHLTLAEDPPDLAVWPENSIDRDPTVNSDLRGLLESSVEALGIPTLIGAITDAPNGGFYNENVLYLPEPGYVARYRKQHPVPFGEYVPFRRWLGFIRELALVPRDMAPGEGPVRFPGPDTGIPDTSLGPSTPPFTSVICFENAFGDLTRQAVKATEAEFLVVSTNNVTFQRTSLSEQHVAWSQIRAAENGKWVVHAALAGISAFVSPRGEVATTTELFELAILRRDIPVIGAKTLYTRLGDWFPLLAGLGVAVAFLFAAPVRRRREAPEPLGLRQGLVILPTYEERATIGEVIRRVLTAAPGVDVLVVDDGSPDGTAGVVRDLGESEPRVRLIEREGKQGLASAYLEGFRLGLDEGYDVIVEMDADLSHQPEELPRLLEAIRDHDVVIGSGYVPGGAVTNWSKARVTLSRGGNLYARTLLRLPLRDATSGFRAFRREVLRDLIAGGISSEGYGFQVELVYRAWRRGYAVAEVPITFREREHGASKISRRIIAEAMLKVAGWAWRDRFRREP